MASNGYIKLYKKMTEWEWYTDGPTLRVYLHLLLTANWKDSNLKGQKIPRGSVLTSYDAIASATGLSKKQVRRAVENLEKTKNVARNRALNSLLITVEKYEFFQGDAAQQGTVQGTRRAFAGHSEGTRRAPYEEYIEEYKEEGEARACARGPYGLLSLSDFQVERLQKQFPHDWERYINEVDEYMAETGRKYANHLAAVLRWGRKDQEYRAAHGSRPQPSKENAAPAAEKFPMEIIEGGNEVCVGVFTLEDFLAHPRNPKHLTPEEWQKEFRRARRGAGGSAKPVNLQASVSEIFGGR